MLDFTCLEASGSGLRLLCDGAGGDSRGKGAGINALASAAVLAERDLRPCD